MTAALALRPAGPDDAERLLAWRNEPATREASGNRDPVGAGEHAAWLEAVLADPDRHLLIAEAEGAAVGQARLDGDGGGGYEISVSLDPERRGRGLGRELIVAACDWAWRSTGAARIEARVRTENRTSLRAFEEAGFTREAGGDPGFVKLALARPG